MHVVVQLLFVILALHVNVSAAGEIKKVPLLVLAPNKYLSCMPYYTVLDMLSSSSVQRYTIDEDFSGEEKIREAKKLLLKDKITEFNAIVFGDAVYPFKVWVEENLKSQNFIIRDVVMIGKASHGQGHVVDHAGGGELKVVAQKKDKVNFISNFFYKDKLKVKDKVKGKDGDKHTAKSKSNLLSITIQTLPDRREPMFSKEQLASLSSEFNTELYSFMCPTIKKRKQDFSFLTKVVEKHLINGNYNDEPKAIIQDDSQHEKIFKIRFSEKDTIHEIPSRQELKEQQAQYNAQILSEHQQQLQQQHQQHLQRQQQHQQHLQLQLQQQQQHQERHPTTQENSDWVPAQEESVSVNSVHTARSQANYKTLMELVKQLRKSQQSLQGQQGQQNQQKNGA